MDKALYLGMSSAKHNMLGQSIRSNNLANASTNGFRSDFEQARSMGVYYGDGHPTRAFALTENPQINYTAGPLVQTGRDLDIAVKGDGFIAVQGKDGREAYTRLGSLSINEFGELSTGSGLPVMGSSGPIVLPNYAKVEIGVDGIISVVAQGAPPDALTEVDTIKLINPDYSELKKGADGLLYSDNEQFADVDIRVVSGFIESSNVNPIEELTRILTLSRQYEMSVKVMQTAQENSESSAQLLQING